MGVMFRKRVKTDYIVIHCSATKPSQNVSARDIKGWHQGQGWLDIGYHAVIKRDGTYEDGRDHAVVGSHVQGYNSNSVGICLVGGVDDKGKFKANFTPAQMQTLKDAIDAMRKEYPNAKVVGHHTLNPNKACPSFNVSRWLSTGELVTSDRD